MTRKLTVFAFASMVFAVVLSVASDAGKPVTANGYVLDSACAFTKGLKKPISAQCAQACAKAGSPSRNLFESFFYRRRINEAEDPGSKTRMTEPL